jgi:hypothetical protein
MINKAAFAYQHPNARSHQANSAFVIWAPIHHPHGRIQAPSDNARNHRTPAASDQKTVARPVGTECNQYR